MVVNNCKQRCVALSVHSFGPCVLTQLPHNRQQNFLVSCLYHNMPISKTLVYLSSLHIVNFNWGLCSFCHSLSPCRWRSMWSAMRIVRWPWSLWSYSAFCHLAGWSLIPPAKLLHSWRYKCLVNRISRNTATSPWNLWPATAMASCLFMKGNTRVHSLKTKKRFSVTLNCYILQYMH